jgi:hypothetical protein
MVEGAVADSEVWGGVDVCFRGAVQSKEAAPKCKSEKKHKRKSQEAILPAVPSGSDSADGGCDAVASAQPPAKRVRFAKHVGRFHKREAAKMVTNYSSSDLAAILGGVTGSQAERSTEEEVRLAVPLLPVPFSFCMLTACRRLCVSKVERLYVC